MAESYLMSPTIADPVDLVNDMALSLERVAVLLASTNSDMMECVVGRLTGPAQGIHHSAYTVWCSNQVAIEKLEEIHKLLAEAAGSLLTLSKKREG